MKTVMSSIFIVLNVIISLLCANAFFASNKRWGNNIVQQQQQQHGSIVQMAVSDKPLKVVESAFDSPSIRKLQKDPKDFTNPFDSPSCKLNGVDTDRAIDPKKSPSCIMLNREGTDEYDSMESPSVVKLGIDADAVKNAMTSPSLQRTSESKTKEDMPLSLIVGQETIKNALILLAVNPKIGGIIIGGGKGTGKSAMARALHRIMPPIEVVKGSEYNVDPEATGSQEMDDFLRNDLEAKGKTLADLETEIITCPFIQIPVNVMEDRLFGSVDVKKTLETGNTVFEPGLLASAHRGILYIDDFNLLDNDLTTMLLQAITDGFVIVEREGISVKYPCNPLMVATYNPEDSDVSDVFLDRVGIALNADTEPLTMEERVMAVQKVLQFNEKRMSDDELQKVYDAEESLKSGIVFAREYLKDTKVSSEQLTYLCEEAIRGGCQGHRAEIAAARVAIASAALEDSKVRADDLRLAVKLAIFPRSRFKNDMPPPPPEEEAMPPPPQSAPKPENAMDDQMTDNEDEQEEDKEDDKEDDKEQEEDDDEEEQGEPEVPEEFMFETEEVGMEDDMMKFSGRQKAGKGGKSGIITSRDRGRYLRPVLPKPGEPLRIAIDATLREAAKNQIWRRQEAKDAGSPEKSVYLEPSDIRGKLMARKAGSLLIFCVDASGSMALNRMNAAKGAACSLLQEAYQSRDKIALIPFQGQAAEVLLPPTRSISMAKSRLDTMPCGGGSPLAHALTQAVRTGLNEMSSGDAGRCVIVLISDGRANVPLDVSLGEAPEEEAPSAEKKDAVKKSAEEKKAERKALQDEVLQIASQIGEMPQFKLLVIDTENKFVSTGMAKEIADKAMGRYHFIPKSSAGAIATVASEAVASLKSGK